MTRRQADYAASEKKLWTEVDTTGAKLDKWWMIRAQGLREVSDTSTSVALNILEASQEPRGRAHMDR
ncbi:MAG: hypothetical protein GXP05_10280 [Alphaproteobacteria bacterium]|nr:hypothetical protein [Alphaproteobacteria bacterium]